MHECSTFLNVFITCLEQPHNTDLFAMLVDQIWFKRNKLRMGEEVADLKLLNLRARDTLHEFQLATATPPKHLLVRTPIKWKPPPSNWVKINFDRAVFKEQAEADLGSIIQNDHSLVMAAATQVIPLPASVEMVEVLAAQRALIFANERGFDKVILEGDSEIAIRAMKCDDYSVASFGHIISDIKALSAQFRCVIFQHTRRQGNMVAHSLARIACNFPPFCTWMEEVPLSSFAVYFVETINNT